MRALILSADNFEDAELLVPYYRFIEEGFTVDVASMKRGTITGKHGYQVGVDLAFEEVDPDGYDLLLLPGGKAPAEIRRDQSALEIARSFFAHEKPVAAICHGPQILISAGVMEGKRATCYRAVTAELKDAGALYVDREVVVDGNLVTSRCPSDIPAFMREVMKKIRQ